MMTQKDNPYSKMFSIICAEWDGCAEFCHS